MAHVVLETRLAGLPVRRGKVRDIYDLGDRLLMISSDRISAFDWVLPSGIPDKGCVLTQISAFWFDLLGSATPSAHDRPRRVGSSGGNRSCQLARRTMVTKKAEVVPIECVVRGYLAGSGWKEYRQQGTVCGIQLPAGPAAMLAAGRADFHAGDEGAIRSRHQHLVRADGGDRRSRDGRSSCARRAWRFTCAARPTRQTKGIIIADTKFEWGVCDGQLILIDEVLTPDSSRFWPADQYEPGHGQPSFDKQFVRDWLETTGWDKNSPPPALPDEVVTKTRRKYIEAYERFDRLRVRHKLRRSSPALPERGRRWPRLAGKPA